MKVSKYWTANVRESGQIVAKKGEILDWAGGKALLDFGDGKRPRWYPTGKIRPVGDEMKFITPDNVRAAKLAERMAPPELGGVVRIVEGRKMALTICHFLDDRPVKAEKAEYVDGRWEVLVAFRKVIRGKIQIARDWVEGARLRPAGVPGEIQFKFKGEISRRTESIGMASHRQLHVKFTAPHMYHKKARVSPPRVEEVDPRALEVGWQKEMPASYKYFAFGAPKFKTEVRGSVPARGGKIRQSCHEQRHPLFIETISVGGIPPEHEAEKMRAARTEARYFQKNDKPVPSLDEWTRMLMSKTTEKVILDANFRPIAGKLEWE